MTFIKLEMLTLLTNQICVLNAECFLAFQCVTYWAIGTDNDIIHIVDVNILVKLSNLILICSSFHHTFSEENT